MITLTITSCKRPQMFCETIKQFKYNCLDLGLISNIIWVDDHSDSNDYIEMRECLYSLFPMNIIASIKRNDGARGLAHSLNSILKRVNTKYIYHLEDDFVHDRIAFQIIPSLIIMREYPFIKQVLLNERPPFFKTLFTKNKHISFKVWEKGAIQEKGEGVSHYGFTLNPSVIDIEYYKNRFGQFNSTMVESSFEESYDEGIRTACLDGIKLIHLGENKSAFSLNNTNR
jgi:hypothetical protein